MYWLIQMHTIMNLNYIAMNTTTYNSCYFDMNCMLLVFSWCWLTHDEWMANTTIFNSCHFNKNCIVMVTLIDTSAWYHELHCSEYYLVAIILSRSQHRALQFLLDMPQIKYDSTCYLYTSVYKLNTLFDIFTLFQFISTQVILLYIFTWN